MDAAGAASRDRIKALYAERSAMETEMAEIAQRLSGPGMPGLRGSLVDAEGFPAPGVDLYAVRGKKPFFCFSARMPNYTYTRAYATARGSLSLSPAVSTDPGVAREPAASIRGVAPSGSGSTYARNDGFLGGCCRCRDDCFFLSFTYALLGAS